jgi:hypothetical protein
MSDSIEPPNWLLSRAYAAQQLMGLSSLITETNLSIRLTKQKNDKNQITCTNSIAKQ